MTQFVCQLATLMVQYWNDMFVYALCHPMDSLLFSVLILKCKVIVWGSFFNNHPPDFAG